MLNIPNAVQALFKTDGIRKNFRVHFPNGEYRDLTNSDISEKSVKFTESVCSKNVLQFGLAEASRIEFECANVPNIYGAEIECYCEIDASTLASQYQTVMADLPYPVYQVPYGTFTVQSCPRSAGAMWKRRVEAYADNKQGKAFIDDALAVQSYYANLTVNQIILGICGGDDDIGLLSDDGNLTIPVDSFYGTGSIWTYNGKQYDMYIGQSSTAYTASGLTFDVARITTDFDASVYSQMFEEIKTTYGASDSNIQEMLKSFYPNYAFWLTGRPPQRHAFYNPQDSGYIPYLNIYTLEITLPKDYTIELYEDGTLIKSYPFTDLVSSFTAKKYTLTGSDLQKLNAKYEKTGEYPNQSLGTYIDAVDAFSMYEGTLELMACFGKVGRTGKNTYTRLSKSSPISVSVSEYSDMWWDEYDISPIGSLKLIYKDIDLKKEQTIIYSFGDGLSTYDMTNNYLLKNLAVSASDLTNQTVEEFVTGLLDTYFIPNIQDISFTPVQLESLGLPYIEAGDYLEIDDGNNGTVGTYILTRSLSGEQHLEDDIESKGGEIIGDTSRSI